MSSASAAPTLEDAVLWLLETNNTLRALSRLDLRPTANWASNQPRLTLLARVTCAPKVAPAELSQQGWERIRNLADCVEVSVAIESGGATHWDAEPIVGARVRVSAYDRRQAPGRECRWNVGTHDARERRWDEERGRRFPGTLAALTTDLIAWIEEAAPLIPPTRSQAAQRADDEAPAETPPEVTEGQVTETTPEGKIVIRLRSEGFMTCSDGTTRDAFDGLVTKNGGTILHDEPAVSPAGRYVGTFHGGQLREVRYEFEGRRRYAYVLPLHPEIDDWGQHVWVSDRRLTADAAATAIEAALAMQKAARRPCKNTEESSHDSPG